MKDVRMRGGEDVRMRMDVDEDEVALTRTRKMEFRQGRPCTG